MPSAVQQRPLMNFPKTSSKRDQQLDAQLVLTLLDTQQKSRAKGADLLFAEPRRKQRPLLHMFVHYYIYIYIY